MNELISVVLRTLFFYFFIIVLYRIMGKREIGQLGIIDLIISILMAELVAISIEDVEKSLWVTILPLSLLTVLEILLAFISIKSRWFRSLFGGKTSLIICEGKVNYKEMIKQRYSMDDLLISLRQKEIKDIEEVEYAFLEPNGKLSIFKYNFFHTNTTYPMPLILDGSINKKTLEYLGHDEDWLKNKLAYKHLSISEIFYAFYKKNKIYIITNAEL